VHGEDLPSSGVGEPIVPIVATALDPDRIALGRRLFTDNQLSSRGMLSCMSCHNLATGGTLRAPRTIGYQGRMHRFNSPSIFNVGLSYRLGWRGNFTSLEEQNEAVLLDENLMASTWPALLGRLAANPSYVVAFKHSYGGPVQQEYVLDALATFERSLITPDAPFDLYLRGDRGAISSDAVRGYDLFKTYGCASCHQGVNVGGNVFQKFGIFAPVRDPNTMTESDLGRFTATGDSRDIGVFRVPSLRNVAATAPYLHDGSVPTLPKAVELMGQAQLGQEINDDDVKSIVEFLNSLTGKFDGKTLEATD
jgi:cytochrome c peroxidase